MTCDDTCSTTDMLCRVDPELIDEGAPIGIRLCTFALVCRVCPRVVGVVDETNLQSAEVWTGSSYGLAAHLLHRGLVNEGWNVAFGIYNVTYNVRKHTSK